MARCGSCNKFVSLDTSDDPELVSDFEVVAGTLRGDVSIQNNCAECGEALRQTTFNLEMDVSDQIRAHLPECADATLDEREDEDDALKSASDRLEVTASLSRAERTTGKGRGMKTFYGVDAECTVKCTCGHEFMNTLSDDLQASLMDEV